MATSDRSVSRRSFLAGGLAAGALLAGRGLTKASAAQPGVVAASVAKAPAEPDDLAWAQAAPTVVSLLPQNMTVPRITEAGAKQVTVRALYDQDRVGLLVEWADAHKDTDLGTVMQFRDGVAVQFPEDPSVKAPPFTMGAVGNGVLIYHWKSDWQFGQEKDVDEAYPNMRTEMYPFSGVAAGQVPEASDYLTKGSKEYLTAAAAGNTLANPLIQKEIGPVQKMRAEGFGTIEPHKVQDAQGKGQWQDGVWRIVFSLPRLQEKFSFTEGTPYSLAFAVWDGSRNERNGQKAYSLWQTLGLGSLPAVQGPASQDSSLPVLGGAASLAAAAAGLFTLLRWRGERQRKVDQIRKS
jgi:hypothetical protein